MPLARDESGVFFYNPHFYNRNSHKSFMIFIKKYNFEKKSRYGEKRTFKKTDKG